MRSNRVIGAPGINSYHVVSRVVDKRFIFGSAERRVFRDLMERLLAFTGVECLTFCLMSNHFHLLLRVPDHDAFRERVTDEEVVERLRAIYPEAEVVLVEAGLRALRARSGEAADRFRERYVARMCDLSRFVQELKGRFAQWFNRSHNRRGVLWEDRFASVLLEAGRAVETVAAYIDLNPVRAGIVGDPKDYRWSGYGEAVAGVGRARRGLLHVVDPERSGWTWEEVQAAYRRLLFGTAERSGATGMPSRGRERGQAAQIVDRVLRARRALPSSAAVEAVVSEGGRLARTEILLCRVRYFSSGLAIGSRRFIEQVFEAGRGPRAPAGSGHETETGVWGRAKSADERSGKVLAWPLQFGDWGGLTCLRPPRRPPITPAASDEL